MKILVFADGSTREITGDGGKYWLCGEERFRKMGKSVAEIREIPADTGAETGKAPAAPKKKAAKKKKKAEEAEDGERGE